MSMQQMYKLLLLFILVGFLIPACAPRDVVTEDEDDAFAEELRSSEREFDPSEYNDPFAIQQEEDDAPAERPEFVPERDEPDTPQFMQGFRIQLYSTSDMEAAQEVLEVADSIFTDHWIYVVYEVPFYKVRLGDFETRPQANRTLSEVVGEGFRDAWIVPDRVVKDPPEKIIEEEVEEDRDELNDGSEEPDEPPGSPDRSGR